MPISHIHGIAFNHPVMKAGQRFTVSKDSGSCFEVSLSIEAEGGKARLLADIVRCGDGAVSAVRLEPREVKLLHEQTVRRKVVGLMIPHLASTMADWLREGLYDPFADKDRIEKKSA